MLRHIDGDALEAFIVARLQFRDATIAMRGEPLVVIGDKMDRVNPLLTTQHKAMLLLLKAASDLGFTPSSRAKVQTVDGLEDEEDLDNPFSIGRKQA
jgi:P27 family predicted phage terminase small subunit